MTARLPTWPPTASPILGELRRALCSRSKALRHRLAHWDCAQQLDEVDGRTTESWTVDFHTHRATLLLRLWDDGVFWFSTRETAAHRTIFELSFHGNVRPDRVPELVRAIEASFTPASVRKTVDAAQEQILQLWADFEPKEIQRGGR
ncbi:MAG: hypothetical protein KDC87_11880 [Planctomycetes bacterium]|nr:hypothetical protein [Planctomycetota bacterium]MCB9871764.1 hypothetical protein [Planctomycetota bacterium]